MFYSTAGDAASREQCAGVLESDKVREWFTREPNKGGFTQEGWSGSQVAYGDVRKHGYNLIKEDFPNIVRASDGQVSYIAGFFSVPWFNCIRGGQGCKKDYADAKSYCEKNKGRLATHGDYLMIKDEIASHDGYNDSGQYFWIYDIAVSHPGRFGTIWLRKVFIRKLNITSRADEDSEHYLFCVYNSL